MIFNINSFGSFFCHELFSNFLIQQFLLGFFATYLFSYLTYSCVFGKDFKKAFKIQNNIGKSRWLYLLILIYFIIIYCINLEPSSLFIYLDDSPVVNVVLEGVKISLRGEYLVLLLNKFGYATAFAVGAKIGAMFVKKYPLCLTQKIGIVAVSESTSFKIASQSGLITTGQLSASRSSQDSVIDLKFENVNITTNEGSIQNLVSFFKSQTSTSEAILPRFNS